MTSSMSRMRASQLRQRPGCPAFEARKRDGEIVATVASIVDHPTDAATIAHSPHVAIIPF